MLIRQKRGIFERNKGATVLACLPSRRASGERNGIVKMGELAFPTDGGGTKSLSSQNLKTEPTRHRLLWRIHPFSSKKHQAPKQTTEQQKKKKPEKAEKAEQRVAREPKRDASRPFHRFIYQVSKERDRIRDSIDTNPPDINTRAYEAVKATWAKERDLEY